MARKILEAHMALGYDPDLNVHVVKIRVLDWKGGVVERTYRIHIAELREALGMAFKVVKDEILKQMWR